MLTEKELLRTYSLDVQQAAERVTEYAKNESMTEIEVLLAAVGLEFNWLHSPQAFADFVAIEVEDGKIKDLILTAWSQHEKASQHFGEVFNLLRKLRKLEQK